MVKAATNSDGTAVDLARPAPHRVISTGTSAQVRGLMQAVVEGVKGHTPLALDHYETGGKTGTAQRIDPKCGCYRGYVTSYVDFAPLNDPSIMTYVVITNPRKGDTGTGTAGPVVKDIMTYALPRYGVQPDQKSKEEANARFHLPLTW